MDEPNDNQDETEDEAIAEARKRDALALAELIYDIYQQRALTIG